MSGLRVGLLREGFEAVLILIALLAVIRASGSKRAALFVHPEKNIGVLRIPRWCGELEFPATARVNGLVAQHAVGIEAAGVHGAVGVVVASQLVALLADADDMVGWPRVRAAGLSGLVVVVGEDGVVLRGLGRSTPRRIYDRRRF